jgi:CRISPR-associated endonuclease/helicase Cas3
LRGQLVDNREWLSDPGSPAIIVGTVDMMASRLLFYGYGVSPWTRPYHAGLLGADTLVVLDEAHLVPPFEELLKAIARDPKNEFGPRSAEDRRLLPGFRLMSLSATGRKDLAGNVFQLTKADYEHDVVKQRLHARKWLKIDDGTGNDEKLHEKIAERAWEIRMEPREIGTEPNPARVLVYCNTRDEALKVKTEIDKRAKQRGRACSELIVGERRVRERERLLNWLEEHGFLGEVRSGPEAPSFIIATSAGEVGIDLDADHMVCDLVEWERMVQRLGRVNRWGGDGRAATLNKIMSNLMRANGFLLPSVISGTMRAPATLAKLKNDSTLADLLIKAQTPEPLRPALTRALVDAWSNDIA